MTTVVVDTVAKLIAAMKKSDVRTIEVDESGSPYLLTAALPPINRDLTIRARQADPWKVVLDGQKIKGVGIISVVGSNQAPPRVSVTNLNMTRGYNTVMVTRGSATLNLQSCGIAQGWKRWQGPGHGAGGSGLNAGDGGDSVNVTLDDCDVSGNTNVRAGWWYGGGIWFASPHGTLRMRQCRVTGNVVGIGGVGVGGGVFVGSGDAIFEDTLFEGNSAHDGNGGGLVTHSHAGFVTMRRCTFRGNSASSGGAMTLGGGFIIEGCTIEHNNAGNGDGGGVYVPAPIATGGALYDSLIAFNTAGLSSGAEAFFASPNLSAANVTFATANSEPHAISVVAAHPIKLWCHYGHYGRLAGFISGNISGCVDRCPAGVFGASHYLSSFECSGFCPDGHYCPEASAVPLACPRGTHLPSRGAPSVTNCMPCAPGSYANTSGMAHCEACPHGKLASAPGSLMCALAAPGGYSFDGRFWQRASRQTTERHAPSLRCLFA